MSGKRKLGYAALGVFILVTSSVGYWQYLYRTSPSYRFDSALDDIRKCSSHKNAPQCARPFIASILESRKGADIMDSLTDKVGRKYCHFIGHIVGQESYKKFSDVEASIAQCDRTCESACVHGVIGQAFATKLGYEGDEVDLSHLPEEQIRSVGKQLCTANQTCHGVGHAIFQIKHDIPSSLALCTDVSQPAQRAFCTVGVFMEYADVLEMRSARPGADIGLPSADDLETLCIKNLGARDKRSCFQYLTTIAKAVYGTHDAAVARVKSICEKQNPMNRSACFFGIGAYLNTYLLETRASEAHANCAALPRFADQASCDFGTIAIDMAIRQPAVFSYCAGLTYDPLRLACYQNTFYGLSRRDESVDEAKNTYCGDDAVCVKAAQDFNTDPWEYIVAMPESQAN
jgi:hypothetical protein